MHVALKIFLKYFLWLVAAMQYLSLGNHALGSKLHDLLPHESLAAFPQPFLGHIKA